MKPSTDVREISLTVTDWPPAKDGAISIFNPKHPHHSRVVDLLQKAKQALDDSQWDPTESRPIGLELVISTPGGIPGDATNYLGGVADVLHASRSDEYLGDLAKVTLYRDDGQIEEVRYYVERGDAPCYRVRVWVL